MRRYFAEHLSAWAASLVREKRLDLAVRVSSEPLRLTTVETALPEGKQVRFRLLSVPFYLTSELPRLIEALAR